MQMAVGFRHSHIPLVSMINPNPKRSYSFSSSSLTNRFFKHTLSASLITKTPFKFQVSEATGSATEKRNLFMRRIDIRNEEIVSDKDDHLEKIFFVSDEVHGNSALLNQAEDSNIEYTELLLRGMDARIISLEVACKGGRINEFFVCEKFGMDPGAGEVGSFSSELRRRIAEFSSSNLHFYLISECTADDDSIRYRVYRFSLDQPSVERTFEFPVLSPVFQIENVKMPQGMGFFSVGSQIFMVGGIDSDEKDPYEDERCRNVYVYDTVSGDIRSSAPMKKGKLEPEIIGPYEGKFYVIDRTVRFGMESYDPVLDDWCDLSGPNLDHFKNKKLSCTAFNVRCYAMVNNTIFIMTCKAGLFSYDLRTRVWDWHDDPNRLQQHQTTPSSHSTDPSPSPSAWPFYGGAVQVGDHLFALNGWDDDLHVLQLNPLEYQRTREPSTVSIVEGMPSAPLFFSQGFVAHIGDMRICVLRGSSYLDLTLVTVDVFRVEQVQPNTARFTVEDWCSNSFILDHGSSDRETMNIRAFLPMH